MNVQLNYSLLTNLIKLNYQKANLVPRQLISPG